MHARAAGAVLAAVAFGLGACGGDDGSPNARERELELSVGAPSKASAPTAATRGPLAPGTYYTPTFRPTVTFHVEDGWSIESEGRDGVLFARGDLSVNILVVSRLSALEPPLIPDDESTSEWLARARPYPTDVLGYLRGVPHLDVGEDEPVTVGGRSGVATDVTVARLPEQPGTCLGGPGPCLVPYVFVDTRVVWLATRGSTSRVLVVDGPTGRLLVEESAPDAAQFAESRPAADSLVATLRIA